MKNYFYILIFLVFCIDTYAQKLPYQVLGKVTDAASGEAMPFVGVYLKGTTMGVNTDFEGNYRLNLATLPDSVHVRYVGYLPAARPLSNAANQIINFQISASSQTLAEVVVRAGENPAWAIMRRVLANKELNDKRNLKAYQYESYNKIEIDIDNISQKTQKRRLIRKMLSVIDSLNTLSGDAKNPILPLFISESLTDYYYRSNPDKIKEIILKTKITGIGMEEGSLVSQMIGSTFQEYNFYRNWLNILNKDFVSPLADGWKFYYEYELLDSMFVGKDWCYKISVQPKRPQDLAFSGFIWIENQTYALRQTDLSVGKGANLNFIEKIKIQQELMRTEAGPWIPIKNRILIDIQQISKQSAGMLAKFYSSYKNVKVDQVLDNNFYNKIVEIDPQEWKADENFWQARRHDTLSFQEQQVYKMIDTVRNIPIIKTYVELANILVYGYKRVGKLDFGPYLYTYTYNNVEGHRFRVGLTTNIDFSKRWVIRGYGAYGTYDKRFKYMGGLTYIASRRNWTELSLQHQHDLELLSLNDNSVTNNALFTAFTRLGNLTRGRPYMSESTQATISRQWLHSLTQTLSLRRWNFKPIDSLFNFAYFHPERPSEINTSFVSTELSIETRFGPTETWVINENQRTSLDFGRLPVFIFRYTLGIKNLLGADFNYHKFNATVIQNLPLGVFGKGRYVLNAGYIPSTIPYPLLRGHLGNQTLFYNASAFNMMNFFEFVSDKYASLSYQHNFEGLLLNSIPLIKRLKWRFVANTNVLYGHESSKNADIIPITANGRPVAVFERLGNRPYIEAGYGIENIFKIFRIDFVHRLSYLDRPNVRRFGIFGSLQFKL